MRGYLVNEQYSTDVLHGKIVALGADCAIPEICKTAVSKYPQYLNTSLVDNYCAWAEKGQGGEVEKICMEAVLNAQANDPPPVTEDGDYPWGKPSQLTLGGQRYANVLLKKAGDSPIPVTGILDETTCATWSELCAADLAARRADDPFAPTADFMADRNTGDAFPCHSTSCAGRVSSGGGWAMLSILGLAAVMGSVLYFRRR